MWCKVGQVIGGMESMNTTVVGAAAEGVFVSRYEHTLDSKKRLTIPSDWRELAGEPKRLFVLPGVNDKCLCVYPAREMTRRMERLRNLSIADEKGRQLARTLASRSDLVPWDSQGRIRVKDELLDFAGISSHAMLVGTFDGFEIWDPDTWRELEGSVDQSGLGEAARYVGF